MSLEQLQNVLVDIELALQERDKVARANQDAQAVLKLKAAEEEQGYPATAGQFQKTLHKDAA